MAVDRSTIIQNAQRYTTRGQIDKAIEEWQKLVSLTPQDGNLYNTIGDLYLKKNENPRAIETFMLAAAAFERAGFALKTVAVYKKVLKIDPSSLEVNLKLADLNAERGLTGNAIEDYLKVAKEYGRRGKVQDALEVYRKIANFDPNNTNIRLKLAELSLREKLTNEAIEEYMKIAHIYEQGGRAADAAAIYKKVLEINPKYSEARDALKAGAAPAASQAMPTITGVEEAMAADDWETAAQQVGVLVLHEPANPKLRRLRGRILLQKGEAELAWADYSALADDAGRVGRFDEGIALIREYLAKGPEQAEPLERLALLLDKAGRAHEAVEAYAAVIDAMVHEKTDEAEIVEHFRRMRELDPSGETTNRYRARFEPASAPEEPVVSAAPAEAIDLVAAAEAVDVDPAVVQEAIASMAQPEPSDAEAGAMFQVDPAGSDPDMPAISEPSVSLSKRSGVSHSGNRRTTASPAPEVSQSQRSGASQSRSREASATPPPAKRRRARDLPDYFAEAEVYLKYGLAAKAIEQYQIILSIDQNDLDAHAKLRELFQLEGRIDEAVTHSVLLARLYRARGQREQAEQVLSEAREWNPADPRLQAALDEQSIAAPAAGPGSAADGAPPPEASAPRPKQDLQEWLAEAEFYLQQGLEEQADQLFQTIRQYYPQAPEVVAYFDARQAGQRFAPAAGGRPSAHDQPPEGDLNELADAMNQSGTGSAAAMDNASMSAKLADLFPGAFRGVANEDDAGKDRLAASVEGVIRAVEQGGQPLSPDGPDPHYSLGLAYKEMGLHAEARKEFEQALALPVYRIDAALMIAACHQAEGQPRQALRQIEECLSGVAADDPKWAAVVCQAAALTAELGDPDGAVAQVRRVLAINPDDEPAAALLRRLQEGVGAKEPARPRAAAPRASEPAVEQPLGASARTTKDKRSRISYV